MNKPLFWPENPYPESVFPMTLDEYCAAVPDFDTRTAISGRLGRYFWDIASDDVWEVVSVEIKRLHDACHEAIAICEGCIGRPATAEKLQSVLIKALGEETE